MSVYSVPSSAEACVQQFVTLLNERVKDMSVYSSFMPIIELLLAQSESAIDITPVNRLIGELPPKAKTTGAEPISYLRRHWSSALSAKPKKSTVKVSLPRTTTPTIRTNNNTTNVTNSNTNVTNSNTTNVSSSSTSTPDRALIRDAAEQGGGTVLFSWAQSSLFDTLGIPRDTWNGFCAMAVGEFLVRPDTVQTTLKSTKGKVGLLHLHESYRSSGKASYEYITSAFGLTFVNATSVASLTPANTLRALETYSGTRHLIGLLKTEGGGHAIGVIVSGGKYTFFDAEEGAVELGSRDAFWLFLYRYITHPTKGLDQYYQKVFVATWS